jgi:ABC-2 type transport system permease protein
MNDKNKINWLGIWTVYRRETWRFMKVWNQTIIAPVITTLLFLAVLTLALGGDERKVGGIPFSEFVSAGLIMMAVVQNAFANSSSSLILGKIQGVIIDYLMPPLSGWEVTLGMVAGGISRGILVGLTVTLAISLFVPFHVHSITLAIFYVLSASMMLALLGMLGGIYANGFDQLSAFTNYIITPLSFLSGTFYSIQQLPSFWQKISYYNPFFYMIDGFRYAITGHNDAPIMNGVYIMIAINVILWFIVARLFSIGWRMRS